MHSDVRSLILYCDTVSLGFVLSVVRVGFGVVPSGFISWFLSRAVTVRSCSQCTFVDTLFDVLNLCSGVRSR